MKRLRTTAAIAAGAVLLTVTPLAGAAPPAPTITGGPTGFTSDATPTFTFSAADASGYSCSIDDPTPATACNLTYTPAALPDGPHTFYVTASDLTGSSAASTRAFTVDTTKPVLTLPANQSVDVPNYTGPVAVSYTATASDGSGSGIASFSCTPASGSAFALGVTTVSCTATDNVGNTAVPGSFTVTVTDATAPSAPTVTGGPTGLTTDATPTFTFSAVAGASGYSCSIDNPTPATACNLTYTPAALPDGPHTFYVTASDLAGNTSAASTRAFTVDATAPSAPAVTGGPTGLTTDATPTFTFSAVAGASGYSCSIDNPTPATACNLTYTPAALPDGPHTFYVTASDLAGNTSAASTRAFTVDATAPSAPAVTGGPTGLTTDATPTFTFSAVAGASGYSCSIDNPTPATACNLTYTPAALPDGPHTFYVTASDLAGNTSAASTRAFTVDKTAPVTSITTSIPATITTSALSISFTASGGPATFACKLDDGAFGPCSSPADLTGLDDGLHTFTVRATDAAGNTDVTPATATWTVDATAPALTGPGNLTVQADGPGGTTVTFNVSATDGSPPAPLLPGAVSCSPYSPAQFPLGKSTVTCKATDAVGNIGALSFDVMVVDTTAPTINAPDASFTATSASGISRSDAAMAAYLSGISATDLVSAVTLTTTTPETLPIGVTKIVVTAQDAAGNQAQKTVTLTVLAQGRPAPPPDFTPPGSVQRAAARAADHAVLLTWALPGDKDVTFVRIERSVVGKAGTTTVYRGLGTAFRSKGLANGVAYRFTLVALDKAGNSSKPVVVSATPKAFLLAVPRPGAVVAKPPLLQWAPVPSSRYFNVQLYRSGAKILSAWPTLARLQLTARWTYGGRVLTLKPGLYTWYVWPGVGPRADARYGGLLGKSSFAVALPKTV